ncbi:hypothetical protein BDV96DRAFT_649933 [Lophiotrema nucula]|uniref:GPI anchored protein n=1 Tax=Lophiotrema nucula TaxID=690887 RepID=A0A6A5YZ40_9PLEO|nr:hypothetical protein BDV96DRAFT_649933 [Lophiotrema nucula]
MRTGSGITALAAIAGFALADHDLVFPFVERGDAGNSTDTWQDFHAQVMDVQNDLTTYSVGCATDPCAGWGNLPTFTYTMVIASTTWDMLYSSMPLLSTHTACTFYTDSANPSAFPTSASCEMTNTGRIGTHTNGYEHHFTVPEETDVWNVMSATLRVLDGTASMSTPTGSAGSSRSGTTSGTITTGPTTTPTGSGGGAASGTASSGMAMKTKGAEVWMLGMGVAAGAMFGL